MNVRAKEEHDHTYVSSINTSTDVIDTGIDLFRCSAGHSNCLMVPSGSVTYISGYSENYTNYTTTRVLPVNVRSKRHSHRYRYTTFNHTTQNASGVMRFSRTTTCGLGHSNCVATSSPESITVITGISIASTNNYSTVSYSPSTPFNVRAKIKHNHRIDVPSYFSNPNIYTNIYDCPELHNLCQAKPRNWVWTANRSSYTSQNHE